MSRRGGDDDLDSLNLLLDTVCNMFGIFVFAALIVAIMSVARSAQVLSDTGGRPDHLPTANLAAANRSIEALSEQLERQRTSRSHVFGKRAAEAAERRKAAEAEVAKRRRIHAEYERAVTKTDEFLQQVPQTIERLRAEIESLERAVRQARAVKEVEARTPLRRQLEGRVPVQVVLDEGMVFVLNSWWDHLGPSHHPCDVWCDWNEEAVDPAGSECRVVTCLRGGAIEIHRTAFLREGGGIEAVTPEALAADRRWARFLAALDPARHVVSIRCTPSGFVAFGAVRASIVSAGVPYNAEPVRLDPFYRDSIVEGTPVGQ